MAILLLSINVVNAESLGNTRTIYTFEECDELRVDVEASYPIDDNEYAFIGCDEISEDSWYCDCWNDYNLILTTDLRTKNNYTVIMTYNYSTTVDAVVRHSGGNSNIIYIPTVNIDESILIYLRSSTLKYFYLNKSKHSVKFIEQAGDEYKFLIHSNPVSFNLKVNESKILDIDGSKLNASLIKVNGANKVLDLVLLTDAQGVYIEDEPSIAETIIDIKKNESGNETFVEKGESEFGNDNNTYTDIAFNDNDVVLDDKDDVIENITPLDYNVTESDNTSIYLWGYFWFIIISIGFMIFLFFKNPIYK